MGSATQVVFLSDGAAWAEEIGAEFFTGCTSILDFYVSVTATPSDGGRPGLIRSSA